MIFRIEDNESSDGVHRIYRLEDEDLPIINKNELDIFIANEIRKEVNGANDRRVLSYSRSLGVCLLKYNKLSDKEIHINNEICFYDDYDIPNTEYVEYKNVKTGKLNHLELYGLQDIICKYNNKHKKPKNESDKNQETTPIAVYDFAIDISNNELLNDYLKLFTGMGLKSRASPEKDKEFILFQSPNDYVIKNYSESVYILYALVYKYGMKKKIRNEIISAIDSAFENRFSDDDCNERDGLKLLVKYLFNNREAEHKMVKKIIKDSENSDCYSCYLDPITQFHSIQQLSFEEACVLYRLSENDNFLSERIWEIYEQYYL